MIVVYFVWEDRGADHRPGDGARCVLVPHKERPVKKTRAG
jgi:hypothetical protein